MRFFLLALTLAFFYLTTAASAQSPQPLGGTILQKLLGPATSPNSGKLFPTTEDYCFDHPNGTGCLNGHPAKLQPLPQTIFKTQSIFKTPNGLGGTKTYRSLAAYCHDNPKSPRCAQANLASIEIPGTGLNLPPSWRFAHAHPDALGGINFASLKESLTAQKLVAQLSTAMHVDLSQYAGTLVEIGQLDQAWVSISGNDPLFLLQGQLRIPEGFFSLGNGMTSWRISKSAVLLGKEDSVRNAVARLSSPGTASSASAILMRELSAQNDFWMTGTSRLLVSQTSPLPLGKDVTGYSFALALRNGLQVDVRLKYATSASAQKTLAEIHQKQPTADSHVHVTTAVTGNSLKLGLSVSDRDLSEALQTALSGPVGKQLSAMATALGNAQTKMTIAGGEGMGQASAASVTVHATGSLIRNIQGGELEAAPVHAAAQSATAAPKQQ